MSTTTLPMKRSAAAEAASKKMPERLIKDMTAVFRMLSDKNRLRIVLALAQNGRMHVKALCDLVAQTQPAVSHHLTLMRSIGLVDYDRDGKMNKYYLASDYLCELFTRFFASNPDRTNKLEFSEFCLEFVPHAEA
jgi:ArsR family transcriptional regulator, arsenate/arsenite/antimonite-responsive transcriptional repressor